MWSNFHTHSDYCDGKGPVEQYAQKAAANGMMALGFSSHAPLPFHRPWTMQEDHIDGYVRAIAALKKSFPTLEIYTGLETDYIPGITSPAIFRDKLDYTIGSIHFVEQLPDGTPWEIDGNHALFLDGYTKIFKSDIKAVMHRYYALTREMISTAGPAIVGHLDKIKIQNIGGQFFDEQAPWYRHEIVSTLDTIRAHGTIVEVNTRGIYQKKSSTTYPSPWILELVHQREIPVTLSSDAHHPDDLTNQFPATARLLAAIGFKTLMVLHEGRWQPVPFNERDLAQP
ncbi:MAG TPA: histidinol-phosphatase [Ohtaekwangia sp.]|nr:histidinol-phosphatase [Ohtaekwangia sp.]